MTLNLPLGLGVVLAAVMAAPTAATQHSQPSTAPTCQAIGHAIASAYGPISSVVDNTAKVKALGARAPYSVLRACDVHMPGHQLPLVVTIDAPIHRQFFVGMAEFAAMHGRKAEKLDGAGYGDLAYLLPQTGGGYAVNALIGDEGLTVGYWASARDTKNMAQRIVGLMK